jgi:hypothetical protein
MFTFITDHKSLVTFFWAKNGVSTLAAAKNAEMGSQTIWIPLPDTVHIVTRTWAL